MSVVMRVDLVIFCLEKEKYTKKEKERGRKKEEEMGLMIKKELKK